MFYLWEPFSKAIKNYSVEEIAFSLNQAYLNITNNSPNVGYIKLFKKFSEERETLENQDIENIISLDKRKELSISGIKTNDFSMPDMTTFLIGLIWVETVGKIVDRNFGKRVYANRLSDSKITFFKPYFKAYTQFRDNSLDEMKLLIDNNDSGVTVQLDLKNCFYDVNINYLRVKVDKLLSNHDDTVENNLNYKKINDYVFEYLFKYAAEEKTSRLPIGFLPSNILINLYLSDLDKMIDRELHPRSYARYVDDMILIVQQEFDSYQEQIEIKKHIEEKLRRVVNNFNKEVNASLINEAKLHNNINGFYDKRNIEISFQKDKVMYFMISRSDDYNYIYKFMNTVKTLSSDFYKLVDVSILEEDINRAYQIVDSPTRFSEIIEIKKDKKHLSKVISAVCYTIFSDIQNDNAASVDLAIKFNKKFYDFIDDEFLLEIYDYWLSLIAIELVIVNQSNDIKEVLNNEINDFRNLKIVKRILSLIKEQSIPFITSFVSNYGEIFINQGDPVIKKIARNYLLPVFLNQELYSIEKENANSYSAMKIYEKQLNYISDRLKASEGKDIESFINKFNQLGRSDTIGIKCVLDNSESLIIGQVNILDPDKRIETYVKEGRNYDSTSETIQALNIAADQNVDMLIFPEQGVMLNSLYSVCKSAIKNNMAIIGGLDYFCMEDIILNCTFSIVPISMKTSYGSYRDCRIELSLKRYLAPAEYELFSHSNAQYSPMKHKRIYLANPREEGIHFDFRGSRHSILNCYEATDIKIRFELAEKESHFVHLVTNNKDVEFYDKLGETLARDLMCATTITNYAKYGGTQIYIPYREKYNRIVSYHKGSENVFVYSNKVNGKDLINKRFNNKNMKMKENPPKYYYRNLRGEEEC